MTDKEAVARDALHARYRPIRASIKDVLRLAVKACTVGDLQRAAKQIDLWRDGRILAPEGTQALEMLYDIALFEPNQRGRRAFDGFLTDKATLLGAPDMAVAQGMKEAFFSLFRYAEPHEAAGLWVEDLLDHDRRLWLMDEMLEANASVGLVFGARLFDAGAFHAGFGIMVTSDEETIAMSVQCVKHNGRTPFRHSLAATLYGDALRPALPMSTELVRALTSSIGRISQLEKSSKRVLRLPPAADKTKPPPRRRRPARPSQATKSS